MHISLKRPQLLRPSIKSLVVAHCTHITNVQELAACVVEQ